MDEITNTDLGVLCICALRYCQGRRTYMPAYVIEIVTANIDKISDRDLSVMFLDFEDQKKMGLFGDDCDKRKWLEWGETLKKEIEKRVIDVRIS